MFPDRASHVLLFSPLSKSAQWNFTQTSVKLNQARLDELQRKYCKKFRTCNKCYSLEIKCSCHASFRKLRQFWTFYIDDVFIHRHKPNLWSLYAQYRRVHAGPMSFTYTCTWIKSRDPTVYRMGCQQYMCLFVFGARSTFDCSRPVLLNKPNHRFECSIQRTTRAHRMRLVNVMYWVLSAYDGPFHSHTGIWCDTFGTCLIITISQ